MPAAANWPAAGGSRRRALAGLCVTEIVSYGVIYYAFPVLAGRIAAGTDWSLTGATVAYSAGNLAGAPSYGWFLVAWLAAGTASAGLFYPPAFAALTAWYGPRAEPGTAGRHLDRQVLASRPFVLLATAAALCAFAQYAALVNLVPLLTRRDLPTGLAAWALGLGGAGQVAGRLCYRPLVSRLAPKGRTVAVIAAGAAVTLLLGLLPGPAALLVAASVLAGAVRGTFTFTEATLVADYWWRAATRSSTACSMPR